MVGGDLGPDVYMHSWARAHLKIYMFKMNRNSCKYSATPPTVQQSWSKVNLQNLSQDTAGKLRKELKIWSTNVTLLTYRGELETENKSSLQLNSVNVKVYLKAQFLNLSKISFNYFILSLELSSTVDVGS